VQSPKQVRDRGNWTRIGGRVHTGPDNQAGERENGSSSAFVTYNDAAGGVVMSASSSFDPRRALHGRHADHAAALVRRRFPTLVLLSAAAALLASACGSTSPARHALAPGGSQTTSTSDAGPNAGAASTVTSLGRTDAKHPTTTAKPRAQAKSATSAGSVAVSPLPGTPLPDVVFVTHMVTDFPAAKVHANNTGTWVLQRTVEGSVTHLRWTQQGGDPTRYYQRDLVTSPADVRGLFQTPDGGGDEDCAWDSQPLLLLPQHASPGQSFSDSAACHSRSTRFAFTQQVQVVGPVTVQVDGQERPGLSLHRVVDATLSGDRQLTDHRENDEVWLLHGPLLAQATIHAKVSTRIGINNVQSDFKLDHFVRP
jgi:hypothetical protein